MNEIEIKGLEDTVKMLAKIAGEHRKKLGLMAAHGDSPEDLREQITAIEGAEVRVATEQAKLDYFKGRIKRFTDQATEAAKRDTAEQKAAQEPSRAPPPPEVF